MVWAFLTLAVVLPAIGAMTVAVLVRRRARAAAELGKWTHAALLSTALVRDPDVAGRPRAVQVHNAGTADVEGVTLVVREKDTGVTYIEPYAHILSPGYDLLLQVPAWACSADRLLAVRFVDAEGLTWDLDVASGLLREALMVGGRRR